MFKKCFTGNENYNDLIQNSLKRQKKGLSTLKLICNSPKNLTAIFSIVFKANIASNDLELPNYIQNRVNVPCKKYTQTETVIPFLKQFCYNMFKCSILAVKCFVN